MIDKKKIVDQARFCSVLMGRIKADIETAEEQRWALYRHTVMQTDVTRLRRELNELRKLLNANWD